MKKRFGFTLAEVLITLGIIGVVAAMTIPTLVQNTNSVKFISQYKKTLATLSQAGLMALAHHDIDYSGLSVAAESATETLPTPSLVGLINSTLVGVSYLGTYGTGTYTYINKVTAPSNSYYLYILADGSMIGVHKDAISCSLSGQLDSSALENATVSSDLEGSTSSTKGNALGKCVAFIDVNGVKPPNKEVVCDDATKDSYGSGSCTVSVTGIGDVYPVLLHDGTAQPATTAANGALKLKS